MFLTDEQGRYDHPNHAQHDDLQGDADPLHCGPHYCQVVVVFHHIVEDEFGEVVEYPTDDHTGRVGVTVVADPKPGDGRAMRGMGGMREGQEG